MHLEKLFRLYLEQAKKQALTLVDNDRIRACQWIKKIELETAPDEQKKTLQLRALKLFLLSLESNCWTGPFEEPPEDDKEFTQYDWNYQINDFSNMIRSKQDARRCRGPDDVSYAVSGNRRELVTYKDDPNTGQHCYYACSNEPIEKWSNLQDETFKNESIKNWQDRGELEELNATKSQNSSIDIPRCVRQNTSPEIDFTIYVAQQCDRNQNRSQRMQNSTEKSLHVTPDPPRRQNYQRIQTQRPETPLRLGGRGQTRPYGIEEFGLSQNEQFRSPRGVFQNLDYDRSQTHRSTMPPRLTDDVIDFFENARVQAAPLRESNDNAKEELCARLQKVRYGMNQKPQVEVEQQIEDEPEPVHYEPITLQEPCDEINYSRHLETESNLGLLSTGEMDDEGMFSEQQTIDPRTIFKTKDENFVSRNVIKIETNTTINGNKREVTEEILEREDINVQGRAEEDDNLENVTEPTFESLPGYSPLQLSEHTQKRPMSIQTKPRRITVNYSDLPHENLEDISQPSFQNRSFTQNQAPQSQSHSYSGRYLNGPHDSNLISEGHFLEDPSRQKRQSTMKPLCNNSPFERLDDVCQPKFPSSIEESNDRLSSNRTMLQNRLLPQVDISEQLEYVGQPVFASTFEDSMHRSTQEQANMHLMNQRQLPHVNESERLDEVEQPEFPCSFENSRCNPGHVPYINESERLEDVYQPSFSSSEQSSLRTSRVIPQVEESERLENVSQPIYTSSFENTIPRSERSRLVSKQKPFFQVEESEILADVCQPDFNFFEDSIPSAHQFETSEKLDQVSQPSFVSSFRNDTMPSRNRTRMSPHINLNYDTSENLDHVSHPSGMSSLRDSTMRSRGNKEVSPYRTQPKGVTTVHNYRGILPSNEVSCRERQNPLPRIENSENIDQISQPGLMSFLRDSTITSRKSRGISPCRISPQVETSERLDDVQTASFSCKENSYQRTSRRRRDKSKQEHMHQFQTSQRLDHVQHPQFVSSFENSHENSRAKLRSIRCPRLPQAKSSGELDQSWHLDDVSQPNFQSSYEYSKQRLKAGTPERRPMIHVNTSERLDDVLQPEFSSFDCSTQISGGNTCNLHQRAQQQVDESERLEDVSQPILKSTLKDSIYISPGRKRAQEGRPFPQVDESEWLDDVNHPDFPSTVQESRQASKSSRQEQKRLFSEMIASEMLDDITQPQHPSFFEDSEYTTMQNERSIPRPLPDVKGSERLDSVVEPDLTSFENSRSRSKSRRSIPNVDESENLDEVSQPIFQPSVEEFNHTSEVRDQTRGINRKENEIRYSERVIEGFGNMPKRSGKTSKRRPQTNVDSLKSSRTPMQRNLLYVDECEQLENVSHPPFCSSFKDCSTKNRIKRPFFQANESELLDDVSQPGFPQSFEQSRVMSRQEKNGPPIFKDSKQTSNQRGQFTEKNIYPGTNDSERLDDIAQPDFATSFEETAERSKGISGRTPMHQSCNYMHISGRKGNLPHQKMFADSERLDEVCQPSFPNSFEDSIHCSRRKRFMSKSPYFPNEMLETVDQPEFSCPLDRIKQITFDSTPRRLREQRPKLYGSEMLENVEKPEFPSTFQDYAYISSGRRTRTDENRSTHPSKERSKCVSGRSPLHQVGNYMHRSNAAHQKIFPEVDNSERLENVCQPSFPSSYADSRHCSRRNEFSSRSRQMTFPNEMLEDVDQPDFSSSLDCSAQTSFDRRFRPFARQRPKFDTSEMLEDVKKPKFPSTFQDSTHISSGRRMTNLNKRPIPPVDISENIELVSQPDFPISFEDSEHDPLTYRKTFGHCSNYPEENLDDISAPTFQEQRQDSAIRSPRHFSLPVENLENISYPSYQSPKSPRRVLQDRRSRTPQRQLFPQQRSTRADAERHGDYRQVFESMPNYAPFEDQIAPTENIKSSKPFSTRIKMPGTFGHTMAPSVRINEVCRQMQPSQVGAMKAGNFQTPSTQSRAEQFRDIPINTLRPQTQASRSNASRLPAPTASSTRLPMPRTRSQTKIQHQQQRRKTDTPVDQGRLVKKSSVKFYQTKSTYSKRQQDVPKRNQNRI